MNLAQPKYLFFPSQFIKAGVKTRHFRKTIVPTPYTWATAHLLLIMPSDSFLKIGFLKKKQIRWKHSSFDDPVLPDWHK